MGPREADHETTKVHEEEADNVDRHREEYEQDGETEEDKPMNEGLGRVAYSMDVKALYPSITAAHAGVSVKKAVEGTTMRIANFDYGLALRYIAKNAKDDKEVAAWGMAQSGPKLEGGDRE